MTGIYRRNIQMTGGVKEVLEDLKRLCYSICPSGSVPRNCYVYK